MRFAENLRELRRERNLSQEGVAELLGVSRQAVSKWEQGEGYPEVEKLLVLARELGISLDNLMGMEVTGKSAGEMRSILINSPYENVMVSCCKVSSSRKMMGGKDSPAYFLFGVSSGMSSFWGEPTTFLGWYRDQDSITKEVEEIRRAILRGEPSYTLQYSVKTQRRWGRIKIVEE
ncbi:MAG: helix-turn-helix transcriptional regulator [Ruminiclostridium sp.]|nr:helix-turn-helix transcriptional regulator [Ruminiclostridium sp.]